LVLGRRPLGAVLHSSNEPGELSQWLCHDGSTINVVLDIIIIIIIIIIRSNTCNITETRATLQETPATLHAFASASAVCVRIRIRVRVM